MKTGLITLIFYDFFSELFLLLFTTSMTRPTAGDGWKITTENVQFINTFLPLGVNLCLINFQWFLQNKKKLKSFVFFRGNQIGGNSVKSYDFYRPIFKRKSTSLLMMFRKVMNFLIFLADKKVITPRIVGRRKRFSSSTSQKKILIKVILFIYTMINFVALLNLVV